MHSRFVQQHNEVVNSIPDSLCTHRYIMYWPASIDGHASMTSMLHKITVKPAMNTSPLVCKCQLRMLALMRAHNVSQVAEERTFFSGRPLSLSKNCIHSVEIRTLDDKGGHNRVTQLRHVTWCVTSLVKMATAA